MVDIKSNIKYLHVFIQTHLPSSTSHVAESTGAKHLDVPGTNLHGNYMYLASWMASFVVEYGSKEGAEHSLQCCQFVQTASKWSLMWELGMFPLPSYDLHHWPSTYTQHLENIVHCKYVVLEIAELLASCHMRHFLAITATLSCDTDSQPLSGGEGRGKGSTVRPQSASC